MLGIAHHRHDCQPKLVAWAWMRSVNLSIVHLARIGLPASLFTRFAAPQATMVRDCLASPVLENDYTVIVCQQKLNTGLGAPFAQRRRSSAASSRGFFRRWNSLPSCMCLGPRRWGYQPDRPDRPRSQLTRSASPRMFFAYKWFSSAGLGNHTVDGLAENYNL